MRVIFAWILIVVGLVGLIGGVGMLTVFSTLGQAARDSHAVQGRMNVGDPTAGMPYRDPDAFTKYGSAAAYILAGGVLFFVGLRFRSAPNESAGGGQRRG